MTGVGAQLLLSFGGVLVDAAAKWLISHPDTAVLILMGGGAYYELHHGTVAKMARNQTVIGTAVYRLLAAQEGLDEEEFRRDLWGDQNGGPYPGDWDRRTE